jgi:cytochrome c1
LKEKQTLILFAAAALVCSAVAIYFVTREQKPTWPPPNRPGIAGRVDHYQCNRCHDAIDKLEPAPRDKHCVKCHQAVFAGAFDEDYPTAKLARWKRRIKHLRDVPTLTDVGGRLRREWMVEYLLSPHDLRPGVEAQMPRFAMTREDAEAITTYFMGEPQALEGSAAKDGAPSEELVEADPSRGQTRMGQLGCMSCHRMTGGPEVPASAIPSDISGAALARAVKLAPDLAHTRERMEPDAVRQWLKDPKSLKRDALMPKIEMSAQDAADIAAFILETPLEAPEKDLKPPERLPLLERDIHWPEVEERVFKHICWHCHSDPAPVGGDGGPGNTGGLGFAGKGLDLGTYAAVKRGGVDAASGERFDILSPRPGSDMPRVVEHMMARHVEVAGGEVEGVRGMPLGLPPMSMKQIQLVESWIAQGARE